MGFNVTYLDVPFAEKEEAKSLGAWWDPQARKWFVPHGKQIQIFRKWLPAETEISEAEEKRPLLDAASRDD